MTSEVEIANLALSNIRAGSINSFDESNIQAQICKLKYPLIRDMMLADNVWGFARKIKGLPLLTVEIFNWGYAYQYPLDCLKINRLIPEHEQLLNADADIVSRMMDNNLLPLKDLRQQVPYEVFNFSENKIIAANESDLRIEYVAKITDPNLFTPSFILAISHLLAAEIAIPIVGKETGRDLRSDSMSMYSEYYASATSDDLNETYYAPGLSEFETIRR